METIVLKNKIQMFQDNSEYAYSFPIHNCMIMKTKTQNLCQERRDVDGKECE